MAFDLHQEPTLEFAVFLKAQLRLPHRCISLLRSHHQGPQTERLKVTEMYCTIVLEARRPESGCWQGHAPSDTKQAVFLASSVSQWGWSSVALGSQLHHSLTSHDPMCVSASSLHEDIILLDLESTPVISSQEHHICKNLISK